MSWVMVYGIVASFLGGLWAQYEREHPQYYLGWGLSVRGAAVISMLTGIFLFPGGYLFVLFAPGRGWLFNIGMVLVTHFIVVQMLGGWVAGALEGPRIRRKMRETRGEALTAARTPGTNGDSEPQH